MTKDEQMILLHLGGKSIREIAVKFDLPYAIAYNVITNAESKATELNKTISNLENQLKFERSEVNRLTSQLEQITSQLELANANNIKLLIRINRLKKSLDNELEKKGINDGEASREVDRLKKKLNEIEANYEKLKEKNKEMLCQESKALAWQVWREKG